MVNINQKPLLSGRWMMIVGITILGIVIAFFVIRPLVLPSGPPNVGAMEKFIPTTPPVLSPDVAFISPEGVPIKLADKRGRVLLVNFWATWCAPCIRELPALAALQRRLAGHDADVMLISVDRKGGKDPAAFLTQLGINDLQSAWDPTNQLIRAFGARGLPVTYMIDRDGMIQGQVTGDAEWDSAEAEALAQYYVARDR